jgi:hypothetical protein
MGNVAAVMTPPPTNRMKFLRSIFTPPLKNPIGYWFFCLT